MSQTYESPFAGTDFVHTVIKSELPDTLDALRSFFSGSTAPTTPSPVAWQVWADTSAAAADGTGGKKVKQWNGAAWVNWTPLGEPARGFRPALHVASLSATTAVALAAAPCACLIRAVQIVTATTTSGSVAATTEWQFMLRNVTQAVDLFSGTVGTGTVLGGVGGGEITLETEDRLLVDQNGGATAKGDVLKLTITKVGAPTSPIVDFIATVDGYAIGP